MSKITIDKLLQRSTDKACFGQSQRSFGGPSWSEESPSPSKVGDQLQTRPKISKHGLAWPFSILGLQDTLDQAAKVSRRRLVGQTTVALDLLFFLVFSRKCGLFRTWPTWSFGARELHILTEEWAAKHSTKYNKVDLNKSEYIQADEVAWVLENCRIK